MKRTAIEDFKLWVGNQFSTSGADGLMTFVDRIVSEEREACAKICDEFDAINDDGHPVRPEGSVTGAEIIARVIRARP